MTEREDELLQAYRTGAVTRRDFIAEAIAIAGSFAAAAPLLEAAGIATAHAEQVDPQAPDLASGIVQYPGPAGAVSAWLVSQLVARIAPGRAAMSSEVSRSVSSAGTSSRKRDRRP